MVFTFSPGIPSSPTFLQAARQVLYDCSVSTPPPLSKALLAVCDLDYDPFMFMQTNKKKYGAFLPRSNVR